MMKELEIIYMRFKYRVSYLVIKDRDWDERLVELSEEKIKRE